MLHDRQSHSLDAPENAGARRVKYLHRAAYPLYRWLMSCLRGSKTIHRCLFGYRPHLPSDICGGYWDWTTLVLKKAVQRYLRTEMSIIDMGTGSVAVLAIFAAIRKEPCRRVLAVDHVPEIISFAQTTTEHLGVDVEFACSDLFDKVEGRHDLILFNAPYLDSPKARQLGLLKNSLEERRFDGGLSGGTTIKRFLDAAPEYLTDEGLVILGVNHYHIEPKVVTDLIEESPLCLHECISNQWTRAAAYVLAPT